MTIDAERLAARLAQIHKRVQWMADEEARAAWVGGPEAYGTLWPEKLRLIEETERILDRLEGKSTNA